MMRPLLPQVALTRMTRVHTAGPVSILQARTILRRRAAVTINPKSAGMTKVCKNHIGLNLSTEGVILLV